MSNQAVNICSLIFILLITSQLKIVWEGTWLSTCITCLLFLITTNKQSSPAPALRNHNHHSTQCSTSGLEASLSQHCFIGSMFISSCPSSWLSFLIMSNVLLQSSIWTIQHHEPWKMLVLPQQFHKHWWTCHQKKICDHYIFQCHLTHVHDCRVLLHNIAFVQILSLGCIQCRWC